MGSRGVDVPLREIARAAELGFGTLHRHFPTREALLEALLRSSFDELADEAAALEVRTDSGAALVAWARDVLSIAHRFSGALTAMATAIEDERSALHASCVAMKAAGTRLLLRAQSDGRARDDVDGVDLFALIGAAAWIAEQPGLSDRRDHLAEIIVAGLVMDDRDNASTMPGRS